LCLPLDAGLGSAAVLLAVLESGTGAALIARPGPADPADWPAFCDAVVVPPGPGAGLEDLQIIDLGPRQGQQARPTAQVWIRSSGTTGAPKWVLHSTAALIANALAAGKRLQQTAQDRVLIPVPIHHMFGLGAAFLPAVLSGASVNLVTRGNPLTIFQAQRSFEPTVMFMVPSQCRSVMALGRKAGRLRLIVVAGDRLSPDEAARFEDMHGPVVNFYGTSELGVISGGVQDDPATLRHVTAGPLVEGVTLAIEDDVSPDPSAEGAVAMRIVHANGFAGYADPKTGLLMTPAPEHWSTGDLVRLHDGGQGAAPRIEVLGRTDFAVNRDGLLVHLGQIEGCLATARGVALCAVVAEGQSRRGKGLVAFCTLTRAGAATADEILNRCRAELSPRAVPDVLHLLEDMPMLPSGKVDRRRLVEIAKEIGLPA
jgi:acyl-coenzyme A synthetase/AMP-(fatty) acid ligase